MTKHIQVRADFAKVRYANCWEDADVLCAALEPQPGKRFLSIASAGDNSFSLLAGGASVVAADLSLAQLACVELRRESFRLLNYENVLEFFGVTECRRRREIYQEIRGGISDASLSFWDQQPEAIADGFIHAGKFESYFKTFRTKVVPLVHSRRRIDELLKPKTLESQEEFYDRQWNSLRWRLLFRLFFSRFVMGRLGRDPEFFRFVEGSVADRILSRTRHALTQIPTSRNPYLRYILTGNYQVDHGADPSSALPHYLRRENFEAIRDGLDRLTLFHGSIQEAASQYSSNEFDGFNLSDIFEYLDPELCQLVYQALLNTARPNARFVYWNMLVPRTVPAALAETVKSLDELAQRLFADDKAWFYSSLVVEEKV